MRRVIVKGKETPEGVVFRLREDGQSVFRTIPFRNYFYVSKDDEFLLEQHKGTFIDEVEDITDTHNKQFVKLYLVDNTKRYLLKNILENNNITTYEADVSAVTRFMTTQDTSWQDMEELRVGYFDLETDDREDMEFDHNGTVIAKSRILSCAIGPQQGDNEDIVYFANEDIDADSDEPEKELLKKIFQELKKYDVISAWNADGFDIPYLKQRQEALGLQDEFDWSFINYMDDLIVFKAAYNQGYKSYSLNSVALQFIGEEKIKLMEYFNEPDRTGLGKFYHMFKTDPDTFREYNIKDVRLMQLIEQKANNYRSRFIMAKITSSFLQDTIYNSILTDNNFLSYAHKKNVVVKNMPSMAEKEQRKQQENPGGGYTFCYEPGVHKNIEVWDYKSHYPLIMITFNISPDTFVMSREPCEVEMQNIFTKEELMYMKFAEEIAPDHRAVSGGMKVSYQKELDAFREKHGITATLEELMFRFTEQYEAKAITAFASSRDFVFTPADFNRDTGGWKMHPHRFYTRSKKGVFPEMSEDTLSERDVVKYGMAEKEKTIDGYYGSEEYYTDFYYQNALKILGNSFYGVLGAIHTRFFLYDNVDAVTSTGRWIMKQSIIHARKKNLLVTNGDTDSIFLQVPCENEEEKQQKIQELNHEFFSLYQRLFSRFNTNLKKEVMHPVTKEKTIVSYWCVFEHEKSYPELIVVARKRYYYLNKSRDGVETTGGAFKKSDTNPLAATLQKELCYDILTGSFIEDDWKKRLLELKEQCFNNELPEDALVFSKKYTRHHSNFGAVMIDKKTGLPKTTKDGKTRYAPVPVHIRLVQRLEKLHYTFSVGDTIEFIIKEPVITQEERAYKNGTTKIVDVKPTSQEAMSVAEYRSGERYDAETYWERITNPVIEILRVVCPDKVYAKECFGECWNLTEKQLEKQQEKLDEE